MSSLRTAADVFASPSRGMGEAAAARSIVFPLIAATVVSVLVNVIAMPHLDLRKPVIEAMDRKPETTAEMTPHQREEAVAQGARLGRLLGYAGGAVAPVAVAVAVAFFLFVAFRVAGARPPFVPVLAVASWAFLPGYVKSILAVPAILRQQALDPRALDRLLPTSPAAFFPDGATGVHVRLLSALDLFVLWSLVLMILGMAQVAGVSRARAAAVVLVLWLAWVAISKVALGAMAS